MLPNRTTDRTGAVSTPDEPDQPTIAGRALRALRTTREPVQPEPEIPPPDPTVAAAPETAPVDLTKAEPRPAAPKPRSEPVRVSRSGLLIASLVVVAVTAAYAVVGLVIYLRGTDSTTSKAAHARDAALTAARIDIATLNTLSYKDVQPGLQKWLNVSTGDFHDQIAQQAKSVQSAITTAKMTTVGRVIAAAVTDLNSARTSATVIASLDTTKTPAGGKSALDRNRYRATMRLVDGVWKVADLSIVAVGLS